MLVLEVFFPCVIIPCLLYLFIIPHTYFSFLYIDCPLMLNPSLRLGEKSMFNLYSWPVMC
jgi:hypothetical protein